MITDVIRKGHAYLRCSECGAEELMVDLNAKFGLRMSPLRISEIEAFALMHAICRPEHVQADLFVNEKSIES